MRLGGSLVVEAGATGDRLDAGRGVTPELTLAVRRPARSGRGSTASRRAIRRPDGHALSCAGRGRHRRRRPRRASRRASTASARSSRGGRARRLRRRRAAARSERHVPAPLDADFLDRLDSLYFFPSDVASEVSSVVTVKALGGDRREARRARRPRRRRARRVDRPGRGALGSRAGGAAACAATETTRGRRLPEVVAGPDARPDVLRNDLHAVDFSFAQRLPIPILQSIASEWRALFNVEFGKRREGEDEEQSNRRLAGGLAVSF